MTTVDEGCCGTNVRTWKGVTAQWIGATTSTGTPRRYWFYSPELQLLSETALSEAATPPIEYDYIWFGGEPAAQINNTTGGIAYYFNDHLGAPTLQTDATGTVIWRVERAPYGERYANRVGGERHQPLGLPGQEYESAPDRQYNIFRWYRPSGGRYTQADPVTLARVVDGPIEFATAEAVRVSLLHDPRRQHAYAYGAANPEVVTESLGLYGTPSCTYYSTKCPSAADCKTYYCDTAPFLCPKFGTSQLANCVRQCLQDYDVRNRCSDIRCQLPVQTGPPMSTTVNVSYCTACITAAHGFCFTSCGRDPNKNPFI